MGNFSIEVGYCIDSDIGNEQKAIRDKLKLECNAASNYENEYSKASDTWPMGSYQIYCPNFQDELFGKLPNEEAFNKLISDRVKKGIEYLKYIDDEYQRIINGNNLSS